MECSVVLTVCSPVSVRERKVAIMAGLKTSHKGKQRTGEKSWDVEILKN